MDRDLNITDKTPIAALTVGEFKILFEQLYVEITNKYEINKVNIINRMIKIIIIL